MVYKPSEPAITEKPSPYEWTIHERLEWQKRTEGDCPWSKISCRKHYL
jgi:hypothetical protein